MPDMMMRSGATPARRVALIVVLANILVFALAAMSLVNSHNLYAERAAATSRNINQLVSQSLAGEIDRIDLGLQAVVDEHTRQMAGGWIDPDAMTAFLQRLRARLPILDSLRITNAIGDLAPGSDENLPPSSTTRNRDYFDTLSAHSDAGLVISKPVIGRISGKWVVIFARRLVRPDGVFDGVVFASVAVSSFEQQFAKLDVGPNGTVVMRGDASRDFDVIAKVPGNYVGITRIADRFRAVFANNPNGGTYVAKASSDNIHRTVSYQRVANYPLITLVGLATEDTFANWWREAFKLGALNGVFFGLSVLGGWVVARSWRQRQQASEQLHLLLNSAGAGIFGIDTTGHCTFCNPAAVEMLGYGHPYLLLDRDIREIVQQSRPGDARPDDERGSNGGPRLLDALTMGEGVRADDEFFIRADGEAFPVEYWSYPQISDGLITGAVITFADISERRRMERELETSQQRLHFLAYHDTLTNLPNRIMLHDRFDLAQAYADRFKTMVALLFLDLDNFKSVNDTLGHQVGDSLLQVVAARLSGCLRETDTMCRHGGDEFLVLLTNLNSPEGVAAVLLKLMDKLAAPFDIEGMELSISVSVGIALFPDDGRDFTTLAKKADMAMYRAKESGRNTYRFYDEQMTVDAVENLAMRTGLRRAVERHEFVLHYQPQIDLADGTVRGVEALIRWQHPELGLLPPGRFISVAEDSRLILPIGEWVLTEACRQAAAWRRAGLPPLVVAVNLSAVQFRQGGDDIERVIQVALERSGLEPSQLELEITESMLIQDVDGAIAAIRRLKAMGVGLSIDDFGTGYSNLAYLKRFDVDKLKIDQSFVRDVMTDPNDAAIVRAIVQMAHSMNLMAIAEGVETREAMTLLQAMGCDQAQGFYFARPMPAAELAAFIADHASR